jgi:hypothetical protein
VSPIEEPKVLASDGEGIDRCEATGVAGLLQSKLRAEVPNEFGAPALGRKHSGQEKQIARLH